MNVLVVRLNHAEKPEMFSKCLFFGWKEAEWHTHGIYYLWSTS